MRDADNTPLPILHTIYDVDGDQLSQELQLTYRTRALTGVVGLYYFEQTSDDIVTVELNPPPPGRPARQRQQQGGQQQLGRVHAVDVQRSTTSSR